MFRETVFGFAICPDVASVYLNQVAFLAQKDQADLEAPIILGCAMAHEIGHLLLGSNSHSDTGIMRAKWERSDVELAMIGRKYFATEQAERIRAEVGRRGALQSASIVYALSLPKK